MNSSSKWCFTHERERERERKREREREREREKAKLKEQNTNKILAAHRMQHKSRGGSRYLA